MKCACGAELLTMATQGGTCPSCEAKKRDAARVSDATRSQLTEVLVERALIWHAQRGEAEFALLKGAIAELAAFDNRP